MFKFAGIIFCAAIFLAGCETTPENKPTSLNWTDTNIVRQTFAPRPQKSIAPAPQPSASPAAWISLNRWAAGHKISKPRLISTSPVMTYSVSSGRGTMTLFVGSLEANWNGAEIYLGFEPQIIDGEISLHSLDLEKNLEPLLCEPPLAFPQTNRVIVIDPGHGGMNSGTHSVLDGRFEKEFTLDWARRLAPLLETNGWKVFLTRTSDVYVTNSDRVVFAGKHRADLFISLHFNSTSDRGEKTGGLEIYCITPTGMPSTLTRGYADPWSENLPNNHFDAQNLQLAVKLQTAILRATGIEDRGVRRSRFDTVLRGQNRPAVLIEGGYLSNPTEARLIESAGYRQKLAEAVAAALTPKTRMEN